MRRRACWRNFAATGVVLFLGLALWWWLRPKPAATPALSRIEEVRQRVTPRLAEALQSAGFTLGDALFIRIFKESREVEIWLQPQGAEKFRFFRAYPVWFSGHLGPKLAEGDLQAPEGFYQVALAALNPESDIHLSFDLGFPNAFDAGLGRTGSWIMMHGGRGSEGCFAVTNPVIEEIYLIAEAALRGGQDAFSVHVFPFRMTEERMREAGGSEWLGFWEELREGYLGFERSRVPPEPVVRNQRYEFGAGEPADVAPARQCQAR